MRIGIIGAGASGMIAAVTAADYGGTVTLIEKNERVGQKLLSTGNGKCNLSNLEFNMSKYYCRNKEKLHQIFSVFSLWDMLAFFESRGMMIRSRNGYLYPYSEQASTVLDTFRKGLDNRRIEVVTDCEILKAEYRKETNTYFVIGTGKVWEFDKLIIACGGPASQKKGEGMTGFKLAESFDHTIHKVVPGLVQLRAFDDSFFKAVSGVRCQAKIKLLSGNEVLGEEEGEVQFTDYGLSGIPVFQLSREAAYALETGKRVCVSLNLFPDMEQRTFEHQMRLRYDYYADATMEDFLLGTVNKKINQAMLKAAGLKPSDRISALGFHRVWDFIMSYRNIEVRIASTNGMEHAQVCAGGVDFEEISTEMESLKHHGLYFAGEIIDVDGKCGGFNLQWAWTSGYIAGRNAAGSSTRELISEPQGEEKNAEN